jgi:hypothetical protein
MMNILIVEDDVSTINSRDPGFLSSQRGFAAQALQLLDLTSQAEKEDTRSAEEVETAESRLFPCSGHSYGPEDYFLIPLDERLDLRPVYLADYSWEREYRERYRRAQIRRLRQRLNLLTALIRLFGQLVEAPFFLCTLFLIELRWFLLHGAHPPKLASRAFGGRYFASAGGGVCGLTTP